MVPWYFFSSLVLTDYPTPEEEHNETLTYIRQKFNNTTLDVMDTIDNNGITKWNGEQVKEEIKDHMDKRLRYSEIHKRLTVR